LRAAFGRPVVGASLVAFVGMVMALVQLRHGVVPMLDTVSYWSGVRSFRQGHPFTSTLAPSFSNFDVIEVLHRSGRLPFVDFPIGYPLIAGVLSFGVGVRRSMILVAVAATGIMTFIGVRGPRSRETNLFALAIRGVIALGVVSLPIFRLTTQGALSEPLFCAAVVWFAATFIEYVDEHRSWVAPAALVAACSLFRFVGASLVVLLAVGLWRRRENVRSWSAALGLAVGPVLVNIVWAAVAGGGHRAGWRGLDRHDVTTAIRSIGGWFDSRLGDLRVTYFGADRSLPWWVWVVAVVWLASVVVGAVLVVRRKRVDAPAVCVAAAGLLFAALVAGMAGFDALVIADNRLMLPCGALTAFAVAWSVRTPSVRASGAILAAVLVWVAVTAGVTHLTESFRSSVPSPPLDPVALPNGHPVRVVLTNDADEVHWVSGVPAAYLPFAVNSLTGQPVDTARLFDQLPCEMLRHDGLLVLKDSLFGRGAAADVQRLVSAGRLEQVPSTLGDAYAATTACSG
jgi:hypothetical protein